MPGLIVPFLSAASETAARVPVEGEGSATGVSPAGSVRDPEAPGFAHGIEGPGSAREPDVTPAASGPERDPDAASPEGDDT